MKSKLLIVLVLFFSVLAIGKTKKEIKVSGNCGMCKKTIESSLKIKEVHKADWNKKSKILTVVFDENKISLDSLEQRVAAVGYDTEHYKAKDEVYSELPGCCLYRDNENSKDH